MYAYALCCAAVGGVALENAAAALLRPHAGRLVTVHGGMVAAMDRCARARAEVHSHTAWRS